LIGTIETKRFRASYRPQRGGTADEIVDAIVWLLSDQASYLADMTNVSAGH
jgi:hypothetical protein